jgi:hypothetical protein
MIDNNATITTQPAADTAAQNARTERQFDRRFLKIGRTGLSFGYKTIHPLGQFTQCVMPPLFALGPPPANRVSNRGHCAKGDHSGVV